MLLWRLPLRKNDLKSISSFNPYATNPLQLIHTDLCGPMPTSSLTGALYFLTFINDCTHYTIITFLRMKSDALSHFLAYKILLKTNESKIQNYEVIMEANSVRKNSMTNYNHKESCIRQPYHNILNKTEKKRERIEHSWMLIDQC